MGKIIPLKSYEKFETFSCWWFSLNPGRFQVISKTARSCIMPLSRNRFFKYAPREELELLSVCAWTSLCFSRVFLLLDLHPLLIALHPFTGIEQVIYRWKAAANRQLSRVDCFFILATILKVFHLKFIHYSSWTSCCFQLNFCDVFSFIIFSSIHQRYTNDIPFVQISLTIIFFNFLRWSTWTYNNKTFSLCFFISF